MRYRFLIVVTFLSATVNAAEPGRAVNGDPTNEVFLANAQLSGWLLDNAGNAGRDGGGFNLLSHALFPGKSIYRDTMVGLNFEHIFNGAAADEAISMFTPRMNPNKLHVASPRRASLHWPAADSAWAIDCTMTYSFNEPDAIDMEFSATPRKETWPQGYLAFMWASYMNRTVERPIHFWGTDGTREGWMSFGEDTENAPGFEVGTVAFQGAPLLPYESGSKTLNIIEHPTKRFVLPFYYGLLDGDHDLNTTDDRLAYVLMFDQAAPMRFALWNFINDNDGKPDPHSPAWDWQYVIRAPKVGQTYGYRMRVIVMPFTTRDEVLLRYRAWAESSPIGHLDP